MTQRIDIGKGIQEAFDLLEDGLKVVSEKVSASGVQGNYEIGVTRSLAFEWSSKEGLSLKGDVSASTGAGVGNRLPGQQSSILILLDKLAYGSLVALTCFGAYRIGVFLVKPKTTTTARGLVPQGTFKRTELYIGAIVIISSGIYLAGRWYRAADFTGILYPR